ncbi:MAG: hypothetical protein PHY93_17230 [Bacteriovorax sp.]|nr:hypothetical protein [Bacteriovorax sp.]
MMKYIMFAIKMIPVITILQGLISGGSRMGPLVDTAKVAITQYEVAQISKAVVESKGPMVIPDKFSDFIREHYYSQYSVLARELNGDREHDHAIDIWGRPFQLIPIEGSGSVKVVSAGPDGLIDNKDDLTVTIEGAASASHQKSLAAAQKKQKNQTKMAEELPVENQVNTNEDQQNLDHNVPVDSEEHREPASVGEFDEDGYDQEGYDQSGFNRDGHNREGHDVNGTQRAEEN